MVREKTIGIITFKRDGKSIKYLLLHHGGDYWNFPKGRQEPGENEMASALRELKEETGIDRIDIIDGFRDEYDYDFSSEIRNGVKEKVHKHAIFVLGEAQSEEVEISDEHLDYGWFDFETALKRMFFQQGRDSLKKAHQFLLSRQGFVL